MCVQREITLLTLEKVGNEITLVHITLYRTNEPNNENRLEG